MPIYEYTCQSCHERFDHLHKRMEDGEKVPCPQCGSSKTARVLSVFAVGAAGEKPSQSTAPGMCCHCGGPGPCEME